MNRIDVGLDGGGTQTRLLAEGPDDERFTAHGPAVNPRIVGIERASKVLATLIEDCIGHYSGGDEFYVCGGIAGAAAPSMQRALTDSVKLDLNTDKPVSIRLTDDATIAHEAAFAGEPGVLFILGTGSTIFMRTVDEEFIRWGGWGYLLGDEGSGYSIGRAGLGAVAAAIDATKPTALTTRAASELAVKTREQLLEKVYGSDYSLASFAPVVLEEADRGDAESASIVEAEIRKLVDRFRWLIDEMDLVIPGSLKVAGGLSESRIYMITFAGIIHEHFPECEITKSGREPVEGALWMAKNMTEHD